jgi:hypothetical protein
MKLMGVAPELTPSAARAAQGERKVYFAFANNGIVGTDIVRAKNDMGAIGDLVLKRCARLRNFVRGLRRPSSGRHPAATFSRFAREGNARNFSRGAEEAIRRKPQ